ncbi:trypsin-like peptidase domain-containing protein [Cystobacter fuscus]|uniref:trypsin-like peptidase domain-containing protein n=1 Tax=Cystobacter fuscus TaxID=43 RepID=UPI002B2E1167|nr:trypsin-like peptidase domain-containing protein [Cystobacter fuscus]
MKMKWSGAALIQLREVLVGLYPMSNDVRRVLTDAGVNTGMVSFDSTPINTWFSALQEAKKNERVVAIIEVALKDYPDHDGLKRALEGVPPPLIPAPDIRNLDWQARMQPGQLEKIIGAKSTLVSVSFLERGMKASRSVVRLVLGNGSFGTGFLIGHNLLLTNNHVLPTVRDAEAAVAQFNYQETMDGFAAPTQEYSLQPNDVFETSKEDDWTVVRVPDAAETTWGFLPIASRQVSKNDRVNIIQHPAGGHKQLSFVHNLVAYADESRVQYLTDTMPGSSGAPVLDTWWNVVALHHSGGWLNEPGGDMRYYRNEGIHVSLIVAALKRRNLIP